MLTSYEIYKLSKGDNYAWCFCNVASQPMSSHLVRLTFLYFMSVLKFSSCRLYIFVMFIHKYFIFYVVTITKVFFITSSLYCSCTCRPLNLCVNFFPATLIHSFIISVHYQFHWKVLRGIAWWSFWGAGTHKKQSNIAWKH